jgi:hypothetical protein
MDDLIISLLYIYGAILFFVIVRAPQSKFAALLVLIVSIRLFCIGGRTSLGSDIDNYLAVLNQCDLSSINALEIFWRIGCLPSAVLSDLISLPFFWIGLIDCTLFVFIARLGGLRVAALYDLVYLQSTSMGAIRQALAMKIVLLAVLLYVARRKNHSSGMLVLIAPLVHFAALVPAAVMKFMTSGLLVRSALIAALLMLGGIMIDDVLVAKVIFYLDFEGFRSVQDIYASWAKRVFVIVSSISLTAPSSLFWGLYAIGLAFAAAEVHLTEIAVRVGAYFEQFEVLLIGAPMKPHLRRVGLVWYGFISLAYTARYMININSLPR